MIEERLEKIFDNMNIFNESSNINFKKFLNKDLELIEENFTKYADRSTINEIKQIKQRFISGQIDGSNYFRYHPTCFCWVGSLANIRNIDVGDLEKDRKSLFERFVFSLRRHDNPENSLISKQVVKWIDNYIEKVNINENM